jgi:hypothetical protein
MHTFNDNANPPKTWTVEINVQAVKRCRALVGVDLYGLVGDGLAGLGKLLGDPVQLVDVLFVICKDEADGRKLTDEDFGRAMRGDAVQAAADAFLEELADFFPDARIRAGLAKVIQASRTLRDRTITLATEEADRKLASLDYDSEARRLIASSGSSPASSASTPDRSPSASST